MTMTTTRRLLAGVLLAAGLCSAGVPAANAEGRSGGQLTSTTRTPPPTRDIPGGQSCGTQQCIDDYRAECKAAGGAGVITESQPGGGTLVECFVESDTAAIAEPTPMKLAIGTPTARVDPPGDQSCGDATCVDDFRAACSEAGGLPIETFVEGGGSQMECGEEANGGLDGE